MFKRFKRFKKFKGGQGKLSAGGMRMEMKNGKVHEPLSGREKYLTGQVVGIAIAIHRALGPGLPVQVYERCFCHELHKREIGYVRQHKIDLVYDDIRIEDGLQIDILIDDLIIIELKAQEAHHPAWEARLLSCLRLTKKRLGYILNFHAPLMKEGIKRMII